MKKLIKPLLKIIAASIVALIYIFIDYFLGFTSLIGCFPMDECQSCRFTNGGQDRIILFMIAYLLILTIFHLGSIRRFVAIKKPLLIGVLILYAIPIIISVATLFEWDEKWCYLTHPNLEPYTTEEMFMHGK